MNTTKHHFQERKINSTQGMIQMVGVSTTLLNYDNVAQLFRVKWVVLFYFNYRPYSLDQ